MKKVYEILAVAAFGMIVGHLLAHLLAPHAKSASLDLWFRAPCANADSGAAPCGWVQTDSGMVMKPGSPLSDLKDAVVYGKRFTDGVEEALMVIPLVGMECDSIPFTIQVADTLFFGPDSTLRGSPMGSVWVRARDHAGNWSCKANEHVFAFPSHWPSDQPPPPTGSPGLVGEYFRGSKNNAFGPLLATRVDPIIDFDWGLFSPVGGVPPDSFSVRWQGKLTVPFGGINRIYVSSADGFRYWIDGALVGDVWIYTFEQEWTTTVALAPGEHTLKMEYFANVGHSACHLKWSGPSVSKQVVPASALSH